MPVMSSESHVAMSLNSTSSVTAKSCTETSPAKLTRGSALPGGRILGVAVDIERAARDRHFDLLIEIGLDEAQVQIGHANVQIRRGGKERDARR